MVPSKKTAQLQPPRKVNVSLCLQGLRCCSGKARQRNSEQNDRAETLQKNVPKLAAAEQAELRVLLCVRPNTDENEAARLVVNSGSLHRSVQESAPGLL